MDRIIEFVNEDSYIYDKKWSTYPALFKITKNTYYFYSFADYCCNFLNDGVDEDECKDYLIPIFKALFDVEGVDTVVLDLNFPYIDKDYDLDYRFRNVLNDVLKNCYNVHYNNYHSTSGSDMTLITIKKK